jgi:ankyrin repeat protein
MQVLIRSHFLNFLACDRGHVATVEILLKSGASNENSRDKKGCTPLHFAVAQGQKVEIR